MPQCRLPCQGNLPVNSQIAVILFRHLQRLAVSRWHAFYANVKGNGTMVSSGHQEYPEGSGNLPELPWEKKPRKWESMRMRSSRQQLITSQVIDSLVAALQLHVAYQQRLSVVAIHQKPPHVLLLEESLRFCKAATGMLPATIPSTLEKNVHTGVSKCPIVVLFIASVHFARLHVVLQ
jgi:hypothetical protein